MRRTSCLRRAALLSMMLTPTLAGCLILDPIDEPVAEINLAPSVVADRSAPEGTASLESVFTLDLSDPEVGSITFTALIRDPNLAQNLKYQVWVDYPGRQLPVLFGDIEPTSSRDYERPFSFTIDNLDLFGAPDCHKVELRVSAEFGSDPTPEELRKPDQIGDLGVGVWWVDAQVDTGGGLAASCNPGGNE